jgi:plasmid stabilization system protein ParE
MDYSIIVSPIAHKNIDDIIEYYSANVSDNIAADFYDELQECYRCLKVNPYFQVRVKWYRSLPLLKFPYLIFFEVHETEKLVRVLAVFNTFQDPDKWPK